MRASLLLPLLALVAGCRSGAAPHPGVTVPSVGPGFAALKARFDADAAHVRVLALLSPT
jgi:hypothetical protein